MTLPHEQILTRVDQATNEEHRVVVCAGCARAKELGIGKVLHEELDGGNDIRFVLVVGLGWVCYQCFVRVLPPRSGS